MLKKIALIAVPALLLAACGGEPTKQDFIDKPELMEKYAEQCTKEMMQGKPSDVCSALLEAQQEMLGNMLKGMMEQFQMHEGAGQ